MWIMTPFGFLAVAASDDPNYELQVRARDRAALQKLRARYMSHGNVSGTHRTPTRDYEYRFYCSKADLAEVLDRLVGEIDSEKFKPTVLRRGMGGRKLYDLYTELWYRIASFYDSPILGRYRTRDSVDDELLK